MYILPAGSWVHVLIFEKGDPDYNRYKAVKIEEIHQTGYTLSGGYDRTHDDVDRIFLTHELLLSMGFTYNPRQNWYYNDVFFIKNSLGKYTLTGYDECQLMYVDEIQTLYQLMTKKELEVTISNKPS